MPSPAARAPGPQRRPAGCGSHRAIDRPAGSARTVVRCRGRRRGRRRAAMAPSSRIRHTHHTGRVGCGPAATLDRAHEHCQQLPENRAHCCRARRRSDLDRAGAKARLKAALRPVGAGALPTIPRARSVCDVPLTAMRVPEPLCASRGASRLRRTLSEGVVFWRISNRGRTSETGLTFSSSGP